MDYPRIEESTLCQGRRVVIACRVMEPELDQVLAEGAEGEETAEVLWLDQALHRTPAKLLGQLQEKIDQVCASEPPGSSWATASAPTAWSASRRGSRGCSSPAAMTASPCFSRLAGPLSGGLPGKTGDLLPDAGLDRGKKRPSRSSRRVCSQIWPGDGAVGHGGGAQALHPHCPDQYGGGGRRRRSGNGRWKTPPC